MQSLADDKEVWGVQRFGLNWRNNTGRKKFGKSCEEQSEREWERESMSVSERERESQVVFEVTSSTGIPLQSKIHKVMSSGDNDGLGHSPQIDAAETARLPHGRHLIISYANKNITSCNHNSNFTGSWSWHWNEPRRPERVRHFRQLRDMLARCTCLDCASTVTQSVFSVLLGRPRAPLCSG